MSKPTITSKLYHVASLMDDFVRAENRVLSDDNLQLLEYIDARCEDIRQLEDENMDLRRDLEAAINSMGMLREYVARLEVNRRTTAPLEARIRDLEADYRRVQDQNHRLIMRSQHLEEYILDCTCREAPVPDTVSHEEDSEMTETDEELPIMPHE